MIWLLIILIEDVYTESLPHERADNPQDFSPIMGDITSQLYVALDNETQSITNLSSVSEMMNLTRRYFMFNIHLVGYPSKMRRRLMICYMTQVTHRTAMVDMDRYFPIRDLYVGNLEYEQGYLTHEVVLHYQMILELYQIIDRRYVQHPNRNFAPVNYVFYMYLNILEQSKIVIHLCNMMHELEAKYLKIKDRGVFADYGDKTGRGDQNLKKAAQQDMTDIDKEKLEYQNWLAKKKKEEKLREKERKEYMKQMKKFGLTTARKGSKTRQSNWPIEYGWSIENW